jgi:hypothetical protein
MDAKDSIYRIHMHSRNHCCAFVGSRASIFPADISPWLGGAVARLDMTGRAAVLDGRIIPVYAARASPSHPWSPEDGKNTRQVDALELSGRNAETIIRSTSMELFLFIEKNGWIDLPFVQRALESFI